MVIGGVAVTWDDNSEEGSYSDEGSVSGSEDGQRSEAAYQQFDDSDETMPFMHYTSMEDQSEQYD